MIVRNDSITEGSISELTDYQVIYDAVFPYDPDVQTYIDAAGITDVTQKEAVNTLVLGLKAGSLWSKIDLIMPILGGTEASHLTNLKGAGTWVSFGSWTHSSAGMIGNGTNAYMLPSVPMSSYTHALERDVHVGAYVSQPSTTGFRMVAGILTTGDDNYARFGLGLNNNTFYGGAYGDLTNLSWGTSFNKFILVNADYGNEPPRPEPPAAGWATASVYKNAVQIASSGSGCYSPISTSYDGPFCIGALYWITSGGPNNVYSAEGTFNGYIKYLTIGGGLTTAEISEYNTLVENFQTAVGRAES